MHTLESVAPVVVDELPATQFEQLDNPDVAPYLPAGHATQVDEAVEPALLEKRPAAQLSQLVAATMAEYLPAAQLVKIQ